MSNEIEVTKGLNFGLDKLDSICQEMAENENYQPTPEEIAAQEKEIRKHEAKEKQKNLEASGIGERYYNASFENYNCNIPERKEVLDKLKLFIQDYQEKTLWMVGNSGTGKTMFAAILCRECLHAHFVKSYEIELELDDCKSFKASESKKELLKSEKEPS
jgi:DNA replication protein DnaC